VKTSLHEYPFGADAPKLFAQSISRSGDRVQRSSEPSEPDDAPSEAASVEASPLEPLEPLAPLEPLDEPSTPPSPPVLVPEPNAPLPSAIEPASTKTAAAREKDLFIAATLWAASTIGSTWRLVTTELPSPVREIAAQPAKRHRRIVRRQTLSTRTLRK
jgi:hypothetical protein